MLRRSAPRTSKIGESVDVRAVVDGDIIITDVSLLAHGGYNSIWLVKLRTHVEIAQATNSKGDYSPLQARRHLIDKFILRLPFQVSLLPSQITNEVAFRRFVTSKLPHIPVPRVYDYGATDEPESSFIVEEFIDGTPLSASWMTFAESQKNSIARKLAMC